MDELARAPRGAGARQPRSAHPLRDPQRLRGRPRRARCPRTPRSWTPPARASRRSTSATSERARRSLLPRSTARGSGTRARASGWAGSASAARSRSSTGCCAAPRTRASRSRSGDARRLPRRPLLHHARLRHAPAARRREDADRHHRASAEPAALRPARSAASREGYGILQPRVSVTMASAAGSLFARHLRRPHRRRSVHDRGLRRLPGPLRRRHLHRQGPLRRRRVRRGARGPRAGERAALARPVRGALRAHRARHRRRGRRRLSVERPRARAPAAPLGARRLADPVVAVPGRADSRGGLAPQPPAAHLALEDPRQPAAQPGGAGDRGCCSLAAGPSCPGIAVALDRRGRWRRWPSPCCPLALERPARPAAAAAVARLPARDESRTCRPALARRRPAAHVPRAPTRARCVHAIGVTLVRLGVTQRRLLEWETAAAQRARAAGTRGAGARSSQAMMARAR